MLWLIARCEQAQHRHHRRAHTLRVEIVAARIQRGDPFRLAFRDPLRGFRAHVHFDGYARLIGTAQMDHPTLLSGTLDCRHANRPHSTMTQGRASAFAVSIRAAKVLLGFLRSCCCLRSARNPYMRGHRHQVWRWMSAVESASIHATVGHYPFGMVGCMLTSGATGTRRYRTVPEKETR